MKDSIHASINVYADLDRVWELLSEPGWWINQGALGGHRIEGSGEDRVVHDAQLGSFEVGIVALEEPRRAVFTWRPGGDTLPRTTVEFTLREPSPGLVTVSVTETGFADMDPDAHARTYPGNVTGWNEELALVRTVAESSPRGED